MRLSRVFSLWVIYFISDCLCQNLSTSSQTAETSQDTPNYDHVTYDLDQSNDEQLRGSSTPCIRPVQPGGGGDVKTFWPLYRDAVLGDQMRLSCTPGLGIRLDNGDKVSTVIERGDFVCNAEGLWVLLESDTFTLETLYARTPICVPREVLLAQVPTDRVRCAPLTVIGSIEVEYSVRHAMSNVYFSGDRAALTCREEGYHLMPQSSRAKVCQNDGKWTDSDVLPVCALGCSPPPALGGIETSIVGPQRECLNMPDDCAWTKEGLIKTGAESHLNCKYSNQYLVGYAVIRCENGNWIHTFPSCKTKVNCVIQSPFAEHLRIEGEAKNLYETDEYLVLTCDPGFAPSGETSLRCLEGGQWSSRPPTCVPSDWTSKRFIASAVIGCMLGVLLLVFIVFFIQRQVLIGRLMSGRGRSRLVEAPSEPRQLSAAANSARINNTPRIGPLDWWDPDRLALIAFADQNGYASRAMRRLPSLSSLRSQPNRPDPAAHPQMHAAAHTRDNHSLSTVEPGSLSTVTHSDGSTLVSVETWSGSSQSASVRAQAGSVGSQDQVFVSSTEDVPLLESTITDETSRNENDDNKPVEI